MTLFPHLTSKAALCGLCAFVFVLGWASCGSDTALDSPELYVASFQTDPPTDVLVERRASQWVVRNGKERVVLNRVGEEELYLVPVFGGSWSGSWVGDQWEGVWTDSLRPSDYRVPVVVSPLVHPLPVDGEQTQSQWATGEGTMWMTQQGDSAWATITTPTGDYRYLAGKLVGNQLIFNTFDGAHLFRFDATMDGDSLIGGTFLSGTHYKTSFTGVRKEQESHAWKSAQQPFNGQTMSIRGVNASGDTVTWDANTLADAGKKGLVVDVMGTWCPNCMDEARLLADLAPQHDDLQFVTLAFERTADTSILPRLSQFQTELGLTWDVLLGGRASKRVAAEAIGVVDTVHSFPTTVFWAPGSDPVIHTGFNGPATGEGYAAEQAFFQDQLNRLSGRSGSR